jgi:hypothetical protein
LVIHTGDIVTGIIQVAVHKQKDLPGSDLEALSYSLLETQDFSGGQK